MRTLGLGRFGTIATALLMLVGTAHAKEPVPSAAPPAPCASLLGFKAQAVEITEASDVAPGPVASGRPDRPGAAPPPPMPAHCLVRGVIERRTGVAGKPYGIHFEMRLPRDWNHRFLFQGGGGINGFVAPATGTVRGPAALAKGFAVVTQDAGHSGMDASFGADQQARIDMIYRSYDRVTVVAKAIVAAYYGAAPDRSYFMGCSEGGREALLVSQRQPLDFDGVVVGDPGMLLGASMKEFAERMAVASISPPGPDGKPDIGKAFSAGDLKLLNDAVVAECDTLDGLKDGIIDDAVGCHPNLDRLACAGAKTETCLTAAQIGVISTVFDGGKPSGTGFTTVGYYYNSALDTPAWLAKFAGRGVVRGDGVNSIQGLFSTPYDPTFDDSAYTFPATGGSRFDEVGSLNRTDGVMLSSFRAHGGKMLMYTGLADQAFSAKQIVDYYAKLAAANGGTAETAGFARLFLVPNMMHCGGGQALDTFDPLTALVEWVEHDKAPTKLIATGTAFPGRSRPLCAFPQQARYKGKGSIEEAANFECRMVDAAGKTSAHGG